MVRLPSRHAPTIAYPEHRLSESRPKRDTTRCLKHYLAPEVYTDIRNITTNTGPPPEQAA